MNINPGKINELAVLAAAMDPKKVAEANAKMEAELVEKMKHMTMEERMKLLAVQKVVTQRTVEALSGLQGGPQAGLENVKANLDPQTVADERLLQSLRSRDLDEFRREMHEQKRGPTALVRFVTDPEPHPLIHWAALDDHVEALRFLISLTRNNPKAAVDQRNVRGETALIWACMKGHTRSIHELIKAGADVHAACAKGYSAMHVAAQNGHVFTMAQLARKGLQVDVRDNNGRTPLHWAAYKGFEHATRWLLSHGADPSAQDWEKCMPIHWASLRAHLNIVALLVEHGASGPFLKMKDKTGGTPMSLAQEKVDKIARELSDNPALEQQPGRNSVSKRQYERVVEYCKRRELVEDAIERNGGKPTLWMRVNAKMPHWSYFLWPVLAPIGWWQYQTVVLPVTSHHYILHLLFIVCFWAKWVFWVRLQIRDPGEYVVPHLSLIHI